MTTPLDRIGRRLSLRDLNIFLVTAEMRSVTKAAKRLAISQPVVSKAIADMERVLGVRLLDRNARGVEPTVFSNALVKRGLAVFDELRQGVNDIRSLADPTAGETRIGATTALVAGIVAATIEKLTRKYPRILIEVLEGDLLTLPNSLRERNIDVLVGRIPALSTDEEFSTEVLFDDRLVVVAGSRSKWARRKQIDFAELRNEPWILPPQGSVGGLLVAEAFRAMGEKLPRPAVATVSMAMHIHLLAAGHFLALLPASTMGVSSRILPLRTLPVALPEQLRPITIATLKNRTLNPTANLFIETLRAIVQPISPPRKFHQRPPNSPLAAP